jgi:hypothetical protein
MRGHDPRIHAPVTARRLSWIAGSSPAMTIEGKGRARRRATELMTETGRPLHAGITLDNEKLHDEAKGAA